MKKTYLFAIMTASAVMLSACGGSGDKVAMEIGGTKVTLGDISVLASQYTSYGYDFDTARDMLAEQIEDTLKYGAVGEAMGIELTDEDRTNVIQMKASYASSGGGLKAYKKYLKKAGSSMDFLDKLFTASAYQSAVMEQIESEQTEPTDDELKTFFTENYYRAKHILIEKESDTEATEEAAEATAEADAEATAEATETPAETKSGKELADELLERAKSGEDFDAMITEYTTDPGSESNPDGYIFTDGDMVQEFEDCVKSLQPGEFGICESDHGYHIIQRLPLSADEAQFETWFTDNKDAVESAYSNKQLENKLDDLCAENNITIVINEDVINGFTEDQMVTPEPTESTSTVG